MTRSLSGHRTLLRAGLCLSLLGSTSCALQAQQTIASRYDVFAGFTSINAPALGLSQPGFHTQAGVNMRSWYSVGVDYSVASGSEILKPDLLPPALQQTITGGILQYQSLGLLPDSYTLAIPTNAFTQTFAAGPQLTYRHFQKLTLFVRPSLGALRETATPHPAAADFSRRESLHNWYQPAPRQTGQDSMALAAAEITPLPGTSASVHRSMPCITIPSTTFSKTDAGRTAIRSVPASISAATSWRPARQRGCAVLEGRARM